MTNLSSRFTVVLKFFLPTVWLILMGGLTLSVLLMKEINAGIGMKLSMIFMFVTGIIFLIFALFRLKRMDADPNHFYVTNYHKNLRYTYDSIEKASFIDLGYHKIMTLYLYEDGTFGKKLTFFLSKRFDEFLIENPNLAPHFGFDLLSEKEASE